MVHTNPNGQNDNNDAPDRPRPPSSWRQSQPWDLSGNYLPYHYGSVAASDGRCRIRRRPQPKIALGDAIHVTDPTIEGPLVRVGQGRCVAPAVIMPAVITGRYLSPTAVFFCEDIHTTIKPFGHATIHASGRRGGAVAEGVGEKGEQWGDEGNDNANDADETNAARSFVSFSLEKETK